MLHSEENGRINKGPPLIENAALFDPMLHKDEIHFIRRKISYTSINWNNE